MEEREFEKEKFEKFMKDHGLTKWGNYNDFPEPYIECDIMKWLNHMQDYGVGEVEHRQPYLNDKFLGSIHLFIYREEIYGVQINRKWNPETREYVDEPKCWKFGCQHKWITTGHTIYGDHWEQCALCGFKRYYDSSG